MYDKESIYDNEIAPLMKQIIAICKREQLPMVAQFYLKEEREDNGEPMHCSTVIIPAKSEMHDEAYDQLKCVSEAMKYGPNGKPFVMAATITTL
jgi:hypothetical protein